jgi:hypothetical protein
MMLTPIPRDRLAASLARFAAGLGDAGALRAFARICATSPERAQGSRAERHRRQALALARRYRIAVHPPGTRCRFNWDGAALDGGTEAYVILHEIAHYRLAPPARRGLVDFGLGPGPDTRARAAAERAAVFGLAARDADEARSSLLGILWEAALGQPALASFLDQIWLEGRNGAAPRHFAAVVAALRRSGRIEAVLGLDRPSRRFRTPALNV